MQPVIILDGKQKSALAAVRSLGKRGVPVSVGATRTSAMAAHSRYKTRTFLYPDPKQHRQAFISAVKTEALLHDETPVVLAFSDATHGALQQAREELEELVQFCWHEVDTYAVACNKAVTYSEAKLLGVPTIPTYLLENEADIRKRANDFSWPMIVKPRQSVSWQGEKGVFGTAAFVQSLDELVEHFLHLKSVTGEAPLVQPLIYGEEYGVEMMLQAGEVIGEVVHHRERSMSPTGGASVVKTTIGDSELVREMVEQAHKLAQALSWTGPLMVEFKQDADSRTPLLMEINGRFWGSLPLAVAAGVDMPWLYYLVCTGQPLPERVQYATIGITTRHFLGDVRHLLRVWFANDPMRDLLYPGRRQTLRGFLAACFRMRGDVWSWRDPLPSMWEYIDVIKR